MSETPNGNGAARPNHSLPDAGASTDTGATAGTGATKPGSPIKGAVIGAAGAIAAAALLAIATIYAGWIQVRGKNPPTSSPAPPQSTQAGQLTIHAPAGRVPRCYTITITGNLPNGSIVWLASQPLGYKLHLLREIQPVPGRSNEWQLRANIEDVEKPGEYHALQAWALSRQTRDNFRSLLVQQWVTMTPQPLLAISMPVYLRRDLVHNERCQ